MNQFEEIPDKRNAASEDSTPCAVAVTRRAFMAGSGGVVASAGLSPARALESPVEFGIEVVADAFRIRFRNVRCVRPIELLIPKVYWSPSTDVVAAKIRFSMAEQKAKVGPDGEVRRSISLAIENARFAGSAAFGALFDFRLVGPDCSICLTLTNWPRSGFTVFTPVDLLDFCEDKPLTTKLVAADTTSLVRSLFGDRLRCADEGVLSLDRNLDWTLAPARPDAFSTVPDLTSGARAAGVTFSTLVFAPSTPGSEPFDPDLHARAFPDLSGATPVNSSGTVNVPTAVTGRGMGAKATRPIALGRIGQVAVSARPVSIDGVTLQQYGDQARTLSALRGSFVITLEADGISEGPFLTQSGSVSRYGKDGTSGLVRLPLADKPFRVDTRNGGFVIEAADAVPPVPGADRIVPGVILSTQAGTMNRFEITGLMRQAFVPFPASFTDPSRPFFSRLDFPGADCRFVLADLPPVSGRPHADSTIALGAPERPAAKSPDAPVRLGLDQAVLRVVRPDDLLSLTFRFSGLALVGTGAGARVVPAADGTCGLRLAEPVNAALQGPSRVAAFRPGAAIDTRPVMVVEFPPQHVDEQVFRRQIDDGEDPPDVALTDDEAEILRGDFALLDAHRRGCRVDARSLVTSRCAIRDRKGSSASPPQSADPAARGEFKAFAEAFETRLVRHPWFAAWPADQKIYAGPEWLDPDSRRFARRLAAEMSRAAPPAVDTRSSLPAGPLASLMDDGGSGDGGAALRSVFDGPPEAPPFPADPLAGLTGHDGCRDHEDDLASVFDDVPFPQNAAVRARLAGPSRLAFRINCDDIDGAGGAFDFTLERLTDWSRFDLAVVRRVEKLLDFDKSGRLPPRWGRREVLDPAARLAQLGIAPATVWDKALGGGRGTPERRMAEVYASADAPPGAFETAIELPYRLALSPAQDARWRTPRFGPGLGRPTPLWQATLDDDISRASLRAVWSADFRPERFVRNTGTSDAPPPDVAGQWFPSTISGDDRHELVTLSSIYGLPVVAHGGPRQLSDGDQIATPDGYALSGLSDDGSDGDTALYLPRPLGLTELALSSLGGSVSLDTHFEPPASVKLLKPGNIKPTNDDKELFPTLRVERWRQRTVLGRDITVEIVYKGFLFPLGVRVSFVKSTERRFMRHPRGGPTAYLIQRLFLRIGRPRKTFPALGQADDCRAFPPRIVDILTRQTPDLINKADDPSGTSDTSATSGAISVTERLDGELVFLQGRQELNVRAFWPRTARSADGDVHFALQIDEAGGAVSLPMIFVDNRAANRPDVIAALTDWYNSTVDESRRTVLHHGTPRRYAPELKSGDTTFETIDWVLQAEGQAGDPPAGQAPSAGAPPANVGDPKDPNRNFVFSPPLQGADQPPFYPRLDTCRIRLNQVGKFTGRTPPETTARFFIPYVRQGFGAAGNAADVFLQTAWTADADKPTLSFGSSGDRAAGVGRPEHLIVALSRGNGPIGGSQQIDKDAGAARVTAPSPAPTTLAASPAEGTPTATPSAAPPAAPPADPPATPDFSSFDPKSFFGSFGKLLGIIDLATVIQLAAGLTGMPELAETVDRTSDQAWSTVRQTILEPLKDVVAALDRSVGEIVKGAGSNAGDLFGSLFADVAKARDAFSDAIDKGMEADAPPLDEQAKLISTVYETARVFVQALEQLAADPIGHIQVALRQKVQGFLDAGVKVASLEVATMAEELRRKIIALINDKAVRPLLIDVHALKDSVPAKIRELAVKVIKQELEATFADIGSSGAALDILNLPTRLAGRISEALRKIAKQQTDIDQQILDQVADRLEKHTDEIEGVLIGKLGTAIDELGKGMVALSKTQLAGLTWSNVATVFETTFKVLNAAADLVDAVPAIAPDQCDQLVDTVDATVSLIALDPSETKADLDQVDACLRDPTGSCGLGSISPSSIAGQILDAMADLSADWARPFRDAIAPNLDRIAALLETMLGLSWDAAKAKTDCSAADYGELGKDVKSATTAFQVRILLGRETFDLIVGTERNLTDLVQNASNLSIRDAVKAAVGSLRIIRALAESLPEKSEIDNATKLLQQVFPQGLPQAQPALSDIKNAIDNAIDDVGKATSFALLSAVVKDSVAGALGQFVAYSDALNTLLAAATRAATPLSGAAEALIQTLSEPISLALSGLCSAYDALNSGRKDLSSDVSGTLTDAHLDGILGPLASKFQAALAVKLTTDFIKAAKEKLNPPPTDPQTIVATIMAIRAAVAECKANNDKIKAIATAIADVGSALLKGDIAKLIDIDAPRRAIEALIRDLIPHKATMAYHLDTELKSFGEVFIPDTDRGDGHLTIDTVATIDLLAADKTPQTTIDGKLDPFNIHLFGDAFDVVLLKFKEAKFGSKPGSGFTFNVDIETVELGEMVEFLKELQSYLVPADGNGFYLRPASGSPGLEVGYGLNLGTISLGPVSFINVSLDAGCRLPFDDGNALFTIGLSRPEAPFLISAGIYGGGGHLALIANGQKIVGFEASFEFGGVAAFSFGPLTGIGRLTTGIFVRKLDNATTIDGFFFCGGSARIACFGISASLTVTISMVPGGAMAGQAVFAFSFSIGFAHIDFHVPVFKSQPALGKSAAIEPERPIRLASIGDLRSVTIPRRAPQPRDPAGPRIHADTLAPERDWRRYRSYFADDLKPAGVA